MQLRHRDPTTPTTPLRTALRWLVTFVGFPLGAVAAEAIAGPVDGLGAALLGGATTGLVLGAAQAWALLPARIPVVPWIAATGGGLMVGLGVGAAAVDYGTSMRDLAVQGAICGCAVGSAQALVLRERVGAVAFVEAPALAAAWALGWIVTTAIGVDVERQYTVFGSSGAVLVTILTVALPLALFGTAPRDAS